MTRADIDRRCTPPGRLARETRWALKRELDLSDAQDLARSRDDIIVKAVTVQGGEADIGGEKTAFARIVMSGVGVQQVKVDDRLAGRTRARRLRPFHRPLRTAAGQTPWLPQRPHELTKDRDNPLKSNSP